MIPGESLPFKDLTLHPPHKKRKKEKYLVSVNHLPLLPRSKCPEADLSWGKWVCGCAVKDHFPVHLMVWESSGFKKILKGNFYFEI